MSASLLVNINLAAGHHNLFNWYMQIILSVTSVQFLVNHIEYIYFSRNLLCFLYLILAASRSFPRRTEFTVQRHDLHHVTQAGACWQD